jgi:L-alanine-DL-glutamate epimerase-like enolase superfamily enzyme
MTVRLDRAPIQRLEADAFTIPTDSPESDGTFEWRATTIVVVHAFAGDAAGLGYSYTHAAVASLVRGALSPVVLSREALDVEGAYDAMQRAVRNLGRDGLAAAAVSAVDTALWDLKARLLGVPLVSLLGGARDGVSAYGSGGFTSYSMERLCSQLAGWVSQGFPAVKMKVGRDPAADRQRVRAAREAIGATASLFADANGAYDRKQALAQAEAFARDGVNWFEEPVSSDDLEGLRLLRDRAPAGMEIAAGEYGYDVQYFRRMLEAGAVDVQQADATRCGGITGFMRVAALCDAFCLPLSAHTAPSLHVHPCCAASRACNVEYFHDHARLEQLLFDGACVPDHGQLRPDRSRPGLGLELKRRDVERVSV